MSCKGIFKSTKSDRVKIKMNLVITITVDNALLVTYLYFLKNENLDYGTITISTTLWKFAAKVSSNVNFVSDNVQ